MMGRFVGLLGFVGLIGLGGAASAHRPVPIVRGGFDVELVCDGSPCEEVRHDGQRWIVGEHGRRYTIALVNRSDLWVEAVVAVDGLGILDGRRTSWRTRGYLVPPNDRIEIEGWRVSSSDVAAFRFTSVADSYAGRVGDASLAGTVRVDFYPEAAPVHWVPRPEPRLGLDDERAPSPMADRALEPSPAKGAARDLRYPGEPDEQHLGTRYGERRWQPIAERAFERADQHHPARTISLRYDDRRGLVTRGVIRSPRWRDDDDRWVPPPPPRWHDDDRWVPEPK